MDDSAGEPPVRARAGTILGASALALTAVGAGALAGMVPGVPLRSGPLQGGSSTEILAPIDQDDTGVFWGVLNLREPSGDPVTLDSVGVDENPDRVELLSPPYIWDDSRTGIMNDGGISAYPLPLPVDLAVPAKQEVDGFTLQSGDSPQVVLEVAKPASASTVTGITVRYHVGWLAYEKTFDMSLTLCPPSDPKPCV